MDLLLNRNEMLDLGDNLAGLTLVCRAGRCWLTQAGDSRDHILRPGDQYQTQAPGQLVVTAVEPCRIQLVAAPAARGVFPLPRQLCA